MARNRLVIVGPLRIVLAIGVSCVVLTAQASLLSRLNNGQSLTISAIGTSETAYSPWFSAMGVWLGTQYPGKVTLDNEAISSTNSTSGINVQLPGARRTIPMRSSLSSPSTIATPCPRAIGRQFADDDQHDSELGRRAEQNRGYRDSDHEQRSVYGRQARLGKLLSRLPRRGGSQRAIADRQLSELAQPLQSRSGDVEQLRTRWNSSERPWRAEYHPSGRSSSVEQSGTRTVLAGLGGDRGAGVVVLWLVEVGPCTMSMGRPFSPLESVLYKDSPPVYLRFPPQQGNWL